MLFWPLRRSHHTGKVMTRVIQGVHDMCDMDFIYIYIYVYAHMVSFYHTCIEIYGFIIIIIVNMSIIT